MEELWRGTAIAIVPFLRSGRHVQWSRGKRRVRTMASEEAEGSRLIDGEALGRRAGEDATFDVESGVDNVRRGNIRDGVSGKGAVGRSPGSLREQGRDREEEAEEQEAGERFAGVM